VNGEIGSLITYGKNDYKDLTIVGKADYSTNYSGTLELFLELIRLKKGDTQLYQKTFDRVVQWMKQYPLKTNKWGPFFEDMPGWTETQINAVTFARFMMNHPAYFPDWKSQVPGIFNWVYVTLGNDKWLKYGVKTVNEQTSCMEPASSHNSRQGSAELQYVKLTGDSSRYDNAIRQLNWATYAVNFDGENRFNGGATWLSDGYGDFVRHYLRAMAIDPTLSNPDENHILESSSVLVEVEYAKESSEIQILCYHSFDENGTEKIRLTAKPSRISMDNIEIKENQQSGNSWSWTEMEKGGVLIVKRVSGLVVRIFR